MGVLHGRDLFSSKYITAEIKDSSKRLWYVPIKYTIGDYFLASIQRQTYCFKIDSEICQYREKLTKQFQVIQYDIKHYRPLKSEIKELELLLKKEGLSKVDGTMAHILRVLSAKEKKEHEFTPHDLDEWIKKISEYEDKNISKVIPKDQHKFSIEMASIINYLDNMGIEKIATPVRGVSEFIEDDLKATDPKFLGTVATTLQNLDFENKRVTNSPSGSKVAWLKWILIISLVVIVALVVYVAYSNGWFDPILNAGKALEDVNFSFTPGAAPTDAGFAQKYPTPEAAKAALDRGELHESQIPPAMRELVKNVKTPEAIPTP